MFKITIFCTFIFVINFICIESIQKRDYISNAFKKGGGFGSFEDIKEWRKSYKKTILDHLDSLPQHIKNKLISKADVSNKKTWVSKSASQYLEFITTGNRVNFETTDTQRRVQLVNLVIGELLTKNGTYLSQICNGLWLIMEESSWETPGHLHIQKAGPGLPDPDENVIDLRVGEMSATVSIIKILLKESLDKVNQMFIKRIDYELNRRIVYPYLHNNDFFWLGFKNQTVNNHNTWDNSNILRTALLGIDDETSRNQVINRSITSIDVFLNLYPDDGGCDEGPVYWEWAGGRLIDYLELLSSVSEGRINWSDNKLIQLIGDYIYKVHISDDRYVNFADAHAVVNPEANSVYKFGQLFNDTTMKKFSSFVAKLYNYESITVVSDFLGSLSVFVSNLLTYSSIKAIEPIAPLPKQFYFKNLQVIVGRTKAGSTKGLFLAAKAGTNHESHNHNDIGNFIIYLNGKPFIIDVGVGVYNNVTFSHDRYSIWSMQSQWHNCPTINGIQQKDGKHYSASNVSFSSTEDTISLTADIAGAYPKEAEVKSYIRNIEFNHKLNTIEVSDKYELKKWLKPLKVHFISHLKHNKTTGEVNFIDKDNSLFMKYNSKLFNVESDHKDIDKDDNLLRDVWGDSVNRVTLIEKQHQNEKQSVQGHFSTSFQIA